MDDGTTMDEYVSFYPQIIGVQSDPIPKIEAESRLAL